ncbi:protein kinase domain-containing protein [Caviibacter abscessus]|uniref:protein kinase domain-containing protein n=1 Tax=Caviibacter abscessus TaxID=1766719 RepID=UPI000838E92A|nr:protein kinase [Caviibacter abscessus]
MKIENGEIVTISSTKFDNNLFIKEYKHLYPYVKNIVNNEIEINYILFKNKIKNVPSIIALKNEKDKTTLYFTKINGVELSKFKLEYLNVIEKFSLFIKIVKIVKSLHDIKIVHNDLKLSNVLITSDKNVYILDFDLSTKLNNNNYIADLYSLSYILYYIFKNETVLYKIKNESYNSIDDYFDKIRELKNELLLKK